MYMKKWWQIKSEEKYFIEWNVNMTEGHVKCLKLHIHVAPLKFYFHGISFIYIV